MGNKLLTHPRVVLVTEIALHYKSSDLERDVHAMLDRWTNRGAPLWVGKQEFLDLFHVVVNGEKHFAVFDTDRDGRVDLIEVLSAYILLSIGPVRAKVTTLFSMFDFQGVGDLNFHEIALLFNAVLRGMAKVCEGQVVQLGQDECEFFVRTLFDHQRVFYSDRVRLDQVLQWCDEDPSPREYIEAFHHAYSLSDVAAKLHGREREQVAVFNLLALMAKDGPRVTVRLLFQNERFLETLAQATQKEQTLLAKAMEDADGHCGFDKFVAVLRPWNVFNECDLDGGRELDSREIATLLWFQLREPPSDDMAMAFLHALDANGDGVVSRIEWVGHIIGQQEDPEEEKREKRLSLGRSATAPTGGRARLAGRASMVGTDMALMEACSAY